MKWGIMATGTIAAKFADTVMKMGGEEQLTACGSRSLEKAEGFAGRYGIRHGYGSYEALAADPEVDAVYIATPNNLHFDNCRPCLDAGKHVLCEKPFTTSADEARLLFGMAREKGRFIMEGFWIRHLPLLKKMQELIKEGVIGDVVYARSDFGFTAQGARKDRKFDSALGGGALLDIGIYNLGFMHMVMGDEKPSGFMSSHHINEHGTDDFSSILLNYPGNRTASVTTSIGMAMPREGVVYGTSGFICLPDYQMAEKLVVCPYGGQPQEICMPFEINGFEYQIREVSRCVKEGMYTSDVLKEKDTLAVLELMDAIRASWGLKFTCEQERLNEK